MSRSWWTCTSGRSYSFPNCSAGTFGAPLASEIFLDSLYRGYPSGSILVWDTDAEIPTRTSAIEQDRTPFRRQKLLLDGQQRITSLTAVLSGEPVKVRGRKNPIDILFNLEHPDGLPEMTEVEGDLEPVVSDEDDIDDDQEEEDDLQARLQQRTFIVANKALAKQPNWVSVTSVFSGATDRQILLSAGVKDFNDPRYENYTERLARLRAMKNYMYVMQVLGREMSYEEVAEIFVRVNSLGMKLRGSDLALAQISAKWPGCLELLEDYQESCEREAFTLDTGLLVRSMMVFATRQPKFARVGSTPVQDLKNGWEEAKQGLDFAMYLFTA